MDVMTLAAKLTLNTSEFNADLSSSEKKMKGLTTGGVAWGNIISNAVTAAGRALKSFAEDTVKTGMSFDSMMSQVKAIGQMGDQDFQKVRKRAMELGETTKFTAAEVGEAFYYMALAGWDTNEMLDGIGGVLNLAAASGENLGRTSDIVTDAITAMGLTAEDAGHFVDVLAQASANSNTTVGQMGEAFKYLATTGGVMKYSIEDVATTLGLLANNGIKATQAGTSMRQILNTLINPSKDAAEAMEALGLSLFDEKTNARKPLVQFLQEARDIFKDAGLQLEEGFDPAELQARLDKLNEWYDEEYAKIEKMPSGQKRALKNLEENYKQRFMDEITPNQSFLAKLGDIGGLRGISSLFAIMNSTDEDFEQLTSVIQDSEGAAEEMSKTMLDNLTGDITILNSAMEGLKIIVSDSFKKDLRSFVQTLTEQIGNLNEAFQENGALGMFVNLADWVVNGIADSLKNPNEEQVQSFGKAIGEFIGSTAAMLVTSLPDLLAGMVTIGESLAGGLVEGLFKGMFGENTDASRIVEGLQRDLNSIEMNDVKAQGILNYLEKLALSGDENVTKTEEWKSAVEQLEAIMPGVKDELEAQGTTLQENINRVRAMTDEFRKQAIQQAMVNTLEKEYETLAQKGVDRQKQITAQEQAQSEQKAITDKLTENVYRYAIRAADLINSGAVADTLGENQRLIEQIKQGGIYVGDEFRSFGSMNAEQLQGVLSQLMEIGSSPFEKDIWETDQNYLSPQEVQSQVNSYNEAADKIDAATSKISEINGEMEGLKSDIATTEAAVQSVTNELNNTASGVGSSGASVTSALSSLAAQVSSISFNTDTDGSHAKGLGYVPYDDYVATLHRGEAVLTASQARKYREGGGTDMSALGAIVQEAIRTGIESATINTYMSGRDVTDDVNRRTVQQLKARRFNP